MEITGKNLIGNELSGDGSQSFQAANPAIGQDIQHVYVDATPDEVKRAIEKAEAAFTKYSQASNENRAIFLETIADELLGLGDELLNIAHQETSLPLGRLTGERGRTMNQLKLFANVVRDGSWVDARIDLAQPERQPFPKADIRQVQIPLGPVGIFGASNFPLAFSVAGGDTASALAAGCPVVAKGHPLHPGTSELVGHAILEAAKKTDMPEGVFSLVQGRGVDVGMAIVNHPAICAIGFTGSFTGGKAIFDAANARPIPIPVFAEMGSVNPVFILPSAIQQMKEEISTGFIHSLNLGVGQFCTNPGLLVTQQSEASDQFKDQLATKLTASDPGNMLSGGIKRNYDSGVNRHASLANVDLVASSGVSSGANGAQSHLFATSGHNFLQSQELEEEVFGPATVLVTAGSKEEMLKIADSLDGHLTATIFGEETELTDYADLIEILQRKVGRLIFNGYPTGVEVCDSMVHGGPFPATTASQSSSVGTSAIKRFARPLCFQNFPQSALPLAIQDDNPLGIFRMVDGVITKE